MSAMKMRSVGCKTQPARLAAHSTLKGRLMISIFTWAATVVLIALIAWFVWKRFAEGLDDKRRKKVERAERVGWYINPFTSNVVLRPLLSIATASIVTSALLVIDNVIGSNLFPWWGALILLALFTLLFALNDPQVEVKAAHVAIVTFFGQRVNIYLEEGNHSWYGGKLGFGWSSDPLPNRQGYKNEAEKGFVFIGDRPISIWPNRKEKGNVVLDNVSGDGSALFTTLTTTSKVYWPLQWANSDDPILDIAERSRSGLRTIASFLPGFDNVKMQSIFSGLMGGHTLVTAFTTERIDIFDRGSVIQDASGVHIFEMVGYKANETKDAYEARVAEAKLRVAERIEREADSKMYAKVLGKDGKPIIQTRHLNDHLVPVLTDCGSHLERATVSSVKQSDEVQKQADKAAGESFQRRGQRMNAAAMKEAGKIMRAELAKPGGETALAAALAADGKGTFSHVHVSGGDALSRAAVAGAKSLGDKK